MTSLTIILFAIAMGLMAFQSYFSYRYKSKRNLQTQDPDYLKRHRAIISLIAVPFLAGAMVTIGLTKPIFPTTSHLEPILSFAAAGCMMIGAYINQGGILYIISQKGKRNPKFLDPDYSASLEKKIKIISYPFLYGALILITILIWI